MVAVAVAVEVAATAEEASTEAKFEVLSLGFMAVLVDKPSRVKFVAAAAAATAAVAVTPDGASFPGVFAAALARDLFFITTRAR